MIVLFYKNKNILIKMSFEENFCKMKKIFVGILVMILTVSCVAFSACDLFIIPSSAVTKYELIRENFAAEKEAEDDAKGREHIEIPEGAETIKIDEEEWIVIRSIEEFEEIWLNNYGDTTREENLQKNYIVANDIELKGWRYPEVKDPFKGKFNGNNYKFYSRKESNGFGDCLFYKLENAVVENMVFSSSDGYYIGLMDYPESNTFLAFRAENTIIKNCVNYFQPKEDSNEPTCGAFVYAVFNCNIENCVNYGDFLNSNGGIAYRACDSVIRNCKNYGNLANDQGELGGIVSILQRDNLIENCENYGHIVGKSCLGGITGSVLKLYDRILYHYLPDGLNEECHTENQIIKNCKNYGNIYLLKEVGDKRLETTLLERFPDYKDIIYEFGGIAGSVYKVENCINEGNFYGFENMGRQIKVDYLGGVVGAAKEVTGCENKGSMNVQNGRALRVGDIYGYLEG